MPACTYRQAMLEAKREYLMSLLNQTHGNVTHAARIAGCRRTQFYKLLKSCGITIPSRWHVQPEMIT